MEELIQQVVSRTGISADHARTAVDTVITFLKAKLPAPIAGQVDAALGGGGGDAGGGLGNIASGVGGLFGKK